MADERKRAACTECREKKLKCTPGPDGSDSCHRCTRLRKVCQIPETKRRKRRVQIRGRMEELESSYSEILSLLKRRPQPESPALESVPSVGPSMNGPVTAILDTGDQLSMAEVQSLVDDYRRMSCRNFPYVIIPENCPTVSLIEEHPMLLQAVLITTNWRAPLRQSKLKTKFLTEVSERYFVKMERSLDLLQALIVYAAWSHLHTAPVAPNVYRLGSVVVSLVLELGVNQGPMNMTQHEMIVGPGSGSPDKNRATSSRFWNHKTRRAFVGAYVLSTYFLILFRKSSSLVYTQYLDDCASSLAADPQYPSDTTLIHHIRPLRVVEDTTAIFDQGCQDKFGELGDDKIQILLKTLSRRLDEWKSTLPPTAFDHERLQRLCYSHQAYVHEVGLYGLLHGQAPTLSRVSIIYECFNSATKYLSAVLDLSLEEMADWSTMDWRSLNFGVMVANKSSVILDSVCFGTEASQRAVWLGRCLDTLCLRAQELHCQTRSASSYFQTVAVDWANMKIYHQNYIQKCLESTTTATSMTNLDTPLSGQELPDGSVFDFGNSHFGPHTFNDLFWTGFAEVESQLRGNGLL